MEFINSLFGYPLGWIMWFCHLIVGNYGFALIIFTLITKLILVPLSIKQQKSTVATALIRPRMEEIQKKYANNKDKQNEEMMKMYQEEGVNPMSGCLPMLIQFPILFGLIDVIYKPLTHIFHMSKDMIAQASDIAVKLAGSAANATMYSTQQIEIVSAVQKNPDAFSAMGADFVNQITSFDMSFMGLDLGQKPTLAFNLLILIPILSGVTSLLLSLFTMKQTSATMPEGSNPAAGMTKSMMFIMPLFSVYFAFMVPAGVGFYWLLSNIFGTIQTMLLHKFYNPQKLAEKAKVEYEQRKEEQRKEKIEAKKRLNQGDQVALEKALSQKEINRLKLAAARKRNAEKYGEEYVEVTDEDLK